MFTKSHQTIIERCLLKETDIDIEWKTILIWFNEPKFKISNKDINIGDTDSKLNARFITYFLPAVEIARKQKVRSRFFIVSWLNMALKRNAENEEQKKIMMANNNLKIDFLKSFFESLFPNDFSLIEYIVPQDILKVPESKFLSLWHLIVKKYPKEIQEIRFQLTKFLYPKQFNTKTYKELTTIQKKELESVDASIAFKYAIWHLFALGDINFEGNYIHNPNWYISIWWEAEVFFNEIRGIAYDVLKDFWSLIFDREVVVFDNYRLVLKNEYKVPPPYNGMFWNEWLLEVTYENNRDLSFYDKEKKLRGQMEYMYSNIIQKETYQDFRNNYRSRYFDLKEKYREAYNINKNR